MTTEVEQHRNCIQSEARSATQLNKVASNQHYVFKFATYVEEAIEVAGPFTATRPLDVPPWFHSATCPL